MTNSEVKAFKRRWRDIYLDLRRRKYGCPIYLRLEAEAEAAEYEMPEWDQDKTPTKEELAAILDRKAAETELGLEDVWPLELEGKIKRERAKKPSSDESPE